MSDPAKNSFWRARGSLYPFMVVIDTGSDVSDGSTAVLALELPQARKTVTPLAAFLERFEPIGTAIRVEPGCLIFWDGTGRRRYCIEKDAGSPHGWRGSWNEPPEDKPTFFQVSDAFFAGLPVGSEPPCR